MSEGWFTLKSDYIVKADNGWGNFYVQRNGLY